MLKMSVNMYWYKKLTKQAGNLSTLQYLHLDGHSPDSIHQTWNCGQDPYEVSKSTKTRMLVQRYNLLSSHYAGA